MKPIKSFKPIKQAKRFKPFKTEKPIKPFKPVKPFKPKRQFMLFKRHDKHGQTSLSMPPSESFLERNSFLYKYALWCYLFCLLSINKTIVLIT